MTNVSSAFGLCFLAASVLAHPIYAALLAIRSRQTVSQHVAEHAHKQGTPTMGGLIVVAGVSLWFASRAVGGGAWLGAFVLLLGYALIGFVDDFLVPRLMKGKRGLGWTQKLVAEAGFAALAIAIGGVTAPVPLGLGIFLILFFANAFNFSDGLDWLSSSIFLALAAGGAAIAWHVGAMGATEVFAALGGAIVPFMVLNRPPAKIFMGDVGSMPIGGLIGLAFGAILDPAISPSLGGLKVASPTIWAALLVLSFVMFAELVPVPIQIASVKLRKKRVFPATPIHHAFQRAGWKETKVVALFFGVQVLCSVLAVAIAFAGGAGK